MSPEYPIWNVFYLNIVIATKEEDKIASFWHFPHFCKYLIKTVPLKCRKNGSSDDWTTTGKGKSAIFTTDNAEYMANKIFHKKFPIYNNDFETVKVGPLDFIIVVDQKTLRNFCSFAKKECLNISIGCPNGESYQKSHPELFLGHSFWSGGNFKRELERRIFQKYLDFAHNQK